MYGQHILKHKILHKYTKVASVQGVEVKSMIDLVMVQNVRVLRGTGKDLLDPHVVVLRSQVGGGMA